MHVVMHFLAITLTVSSWLVLTATPQSSISQSLSASLPLSSAFHLSHSGSRELLTLRFSQTLWSLPKSFILLRRHHALERAQHRLHLNRNKTHLVRVSRFRYYVRKRDLHNSLCLGFFRMDDNCGFWGIGGLTLMSKHRSHWNHWKITLCVIMCNDVNDTRQWQTFGRASDAQ